ncbi:MAG: ABC transporter substrate-binding protein [Deinococcota bacterium]
MASMFSSRLTSSHQLYRVISTAIILSLALLASAQDIPSSFNEAPSLAELVAAGELPPVEERLPIAEDIYVVDVVEEIGDYGGTWNNVSQYSWAGPLRLITYDPPVRWAADYSAYVPGSVTSWEYNEEGTQLTLTLRRGIKWSDGAPFTTEDIQFAWEDLMLNDDYAASGVRGYLRNDDGSPAEMTFPDDYTWVINWTEPQWLAHTVMAQGYWEWENLMYPKHYLSQFHPSYAGDGDYAVLEENAIWYQNPDFPTIFAWQLTDFTPGESWRLERNPYYWKVDAEGNQLPYIDTLEFELVEDAEVRLLNAIQGQYDASFRAVENFTSIPFLLENADEGGYRVINYMKGNGGEPNWMVNQSYRGNGESEEVVAEIRGLLRNPQFRQALSYALDRERVNDVVWQGFSEAKQFTVSPQSLHFASEEGQAVYDEWATSYAEYNVELANQLLDELGMALGDDGVRTLPSGEPFELLIDYWDYGLVDQIADASEIFRVNLEEVGINARLNQLADVNEWLGTLNENSSYMLSAVGAAEMDLWTYPDWVFPVRGERIWPAVGAWYNTGGEVGEAPEPGSVEERLIELYEAGFAEADPAVRNDLMLEVFRLHIEFGPFAIGAAGDIPSPVIVANNFRNVPETGVLGPWAPATPGNQYPEQFFFESN